MVAASIFVVSYLPFYYSTKDYEYFSLETKLCLCLSLNTAMGYGIDLIIKLEKIGEGLTWSNWNKPVTFDDNLTISMIMIILLIISFIQLSIALYVEQIRPGEFGISQPWNFLFTKAFWQKPKNIKENDISLDSMSKKSTEDFEKDPVNHQIGIKILNLKKMYSSTKCAVNGLTMNIFDDQITILLGKNGAGKSTTISMLTGMIRPSSGTAYINDYDIQTNIQRARDSIGFCPQHNILFDELTVEEHIKFYSRLKGLSSIAVEFEVNKYIRLLELDSNLKTLASNLSGGMKRMLSVTLSLCGESKVVFCDEPTSGMDPAARRSLWDLLIKEKRGRSIILTTHFMDEADILGDRIAIMADGELKCCGSPLFLKNRFGTHYRLTCAQEEGGNPEQVTSILKKYIPDIQTHEEIGKRLSFDLPIGKSSTFEAILNELDTKRVLLRINDFNVSTASLNDVFLRVCNNSANGSERHHHDRQYYREIPDLLCPELQLTKGFRLYLNQISAMIQKRFIYWKRTWKWFLVQNLILLTLICLSVLSQKPLSANKINFHDISLESYDKYFVVREKLSIGQIS